MFHRRCVIYIHEGTTGRARNDCDKMNAWQSKSPINRETRNAGTPVKNPYSNLYVQVVVNVCKVNSLLGLIVLVHGLKHKCELNGLMPAFATMRHSDQEVSGLIPGLVIARQAIHWRAMVQH